MNKICTFLVCACLALFTMSASAKGGSRPSYGGGKHSSPHGGHYKDGSGSSHKGGTYKNGKSGDQYGRHK